MESAIVLVKQYMKEPVFEHYFEPTFNRHGIDVTNRHFFGKLSSEEKVLLALKGKFSKQGLYDIMEASCSDIEKDSEEHRDLWRMNPSHKPEWSSEHSVLIDKKPDIIGMYDSPDSASRFFEIEGLSYLSSQMEKDISRTIENISRKFRSLGSKLSGFD